MEDFKKEMKLEKNDGLQLVIQSNSGTINIHNHVNDNTRSIDAKRETEKERNKIFSDFIVSAKEVAKDFIQLENDNKQNRDESLNNDSTKRKRKNN